MNNLKELLSNIWDISPLKLISLSINHNFWDYLSEGKNPVMVSDVMTHFSWKKRPFLLMLDIFSDLGLIKYDETFIYLTPISRKWLVKKSKDYIGDFIVRANNLAKAYDEHLETLLKEDVPDKNMYTLTLNAFGGESYATKIFANSMDAMTREFANEILEKVQYQGILKCLDIGAGLGTMGKIICERNPETEVTFVELPGVAKVLQKRVESFNNSNQYKVIASDWRDLKKHLSPNDKFDLIILSQVLHEEKREHAIKLIEICSKLLVNGGQLAVIGFLDDRLLLTHLFSMNMLMELGSDNLTQNEISSIAESNEVITQYTYTSSTSGRMLWLGKKVLMS